jgi:hypothetical protein
MSALEMPMRANPGWVGSLSGAVGSITQVIRQQNPDDKQFLQAIGTNAGLRHTIVDHSGCVSGQPPGGVDAFLVEYVKYVKVWIEGDVKSQVRSLRAAL